MKKILISVQSCQRDQHLHDRIRNSEWAKNSPHDIRFFMGGATPPRNRADDEVWINMPDGYRDISFKMQHIFRWAMQFDYDYIMEIGNDVDVNIPVLTAHANGHLDYVGEFCGVVGQKHYDKRAHKWYFNYAGGGYLLSRRAVWQIINATPDDWVDDRWVAQVFGLEMVYGLVNTLNVTDLSTHTEANKGKCRTCFKPITEEPLCAEHGGPGWVQ